MASTPRSRPARCGRQRAGYVVATLRVPYALDAIHLGFATGHREDGSLQDDSLPTVDCPVTWLDNDFRDPDLERFVARAREIGPTHAVVADVTDVDALPAALEAAAELRSSGVTPIVVPKARTVLDALADVDDVVLGYPNGYSDIVATDFSTPADWAGHRVHVLGGTPPTQWAAIQRLTGAGTQQRLDAYAAGGAADVVGLDWNGFLPVAFKGEHWHRERPHWRPADDLSIRATIRRSLAEIRAYWRARDVWPAAPAVGLEDALQDAQPTDAVCAACGRDVAPGDVVDSWATADGWVRGVCSERCKAWLAVRGEGTPLDPRRWL